MIFRRMKERLRPRVETGHFEFIEGVEVFDCWGCGAKTNRIDLSWGAHICSVGCRKIVDLRATADLVRLAKKSPDYPEDQWWEDYGQYNDNEPRLF